MFLFLCSLLYIQQEADVAREPMKPRGAGEMAPETQDSTAGPNVRIEFCTS